MNIFTLSRALLMVLLTAALYGCAGLLGPPEPPAPIEDRDHKRVATPAPVPVPIHTGAKTIPLPEQPRLAAQPLITRPAADSNSRMVPGPDLAMTDRAPGQALPELSFPTEPLAPEDEAAVSAEDIAAEPAPPAFSPAVQSLVTAANTAAAEQNWDRAQAALERAVKLAPTKSSVWRQLAAVHLQSGNPERAREVVQRALSLAAADGRENVAAWRLLGDIEQARGDAGAAQMARANAARLMR